MGHAYTPGLRVTPFAVVRRERRLPLPGEVLVTPGQAVRATDVVARTLLPGNVQTVNVAQALGVDPAEVPETLSVPCGQPVDAGKVLACRRGLFGLFQSECKSPVEGVVESVSEVTGQVLVREAPIPVEVDAYLDGMVAEVLAGEGVVVEARGAFVQGIFGIGGETYGPIAVAVASGEEELTPDRVRPEHAGCVVVGGRYASYDTVREAVRVGVRALVVGGFDDRDLKAILGYDLGVAITGTEEVGLSLVLTEGFGHMPMAARTFELLQRHAGRLASVSGATQIRAGVLRPEILIPHEEGAAGGEAPPSAGLEVGSLLRGIREPYFGAIGRVVDLPPDLQELETQARVRVLRAEFDGEPVILPRANVELIES
jgi:hypothetical protein